MQGKRAPGGGVGALGFERVVLFSRKIWVLERVLARIYRRDYHASDCFIFILNGKSGGGTGIRTLEGVNIYSTVKLHVHWKINSIASRRFSLCSTRLRCHCLQFQPLLSFCHRSRKLPSQTGHLNRFPATCRGYPLTKPTL